MKYAFTYNSRSKLNKNKLIAEAKKITWIKKGFRGYSGESIIHYNWKSPTHNWVIGIAFWEKEMMVLNFQTMENKEKHTEIALALGKKINNINFEFDESRTELILKSSNFPNF